MSNESTAETNCPWCQSSDVELMGRRVRSGRRYHRGRVAVMTQTTFRLRCLSCCAEWIDSELTPGIPPRRPTVIDVATRPMRMRLVDRLPPEILEERING